MLISLRIYKLEMKVRRFMGTTTGQIINNILQYIPLLVFIIALKTVLILMVMQSLPNGINKAKFSDNEVESIIPEKVERSASEEKQNGISFEIETEKNWREIVKEKGISNFLEDVLVPSHHNRTPELTMWFFFNRIPRTGGQTIVSLIKALGKDLGYHHQGHEYKTSWQRILSDEEQKHLATWFENNFWPVAYDRFALHVNVSKHLSKYTETSPAYFTMVRDPVEKFISNFHYKRTDRESSKIEMSIREKLKPGSGRKWYLRTLDECVLERDDECDFKANKKDFLSSISFLCGQREDCLLSGSKWALQTAKFNAEYEYSVVGLLEKMNETLAVLDKYVPRFFQGALNKYYSKGFTKRVKRNPKSFKRPSEKTIKTIRDKLALELELYEFLRQRLARQYAFTVHDLRYNMPKEINRTEVLQKAFALYNSELLKLKKGSRKRRKN